MLPASGLAAAVRDSIDRIARHDWARSGQFWRAATREITAPDMRRRRHFFAASGSATSEIAAEGGAAVQGPPAGGGAAWMHTDLEVTRRVEQFNVTDERTLAVGGVELAAWMSAAIKLWNDQLDQEVATLLTGAAVRTSAGGFTDVRLSAAVSELNRQRLGGVVLGSSRPVAICGEGRRGILSVVPGAARSSGDQTAILSAVEYSASVPEDFVCIVHPAFLPIAISYLHQLEPGFAAGRSAQGESMQPGRDMSAVVYQLRSSPALVLDDNDAAVGVVRMIA